MIPLNTLPKHLKDEILIREDTDSTWSNFISEDYSDEFFSLLAERKEKNRQQAFICSTSGRQGVGKSWTNLSIAGFLDDNFSAENIYFDLDVLVNNRNKIKPHNAILIDEQTQVYGTDSHRINVMIQTIKEQLRKKSIHLLNCSPQLREEYRTSQYVIETIFVDRQNKVSYNAFKTNRLETLGYVVIPHPLHFVDKKVLIDYEKKKDEHLNEVLEGPADMIEERANAICKNQIFIKAENVYKKVRGFIPYKILVQLVEKIYPEFKGSVIVYELADRCKCNKEISGDWKIYTNKGGD